MGEGAEKESVRAWAESSGLLGRVFFMFDPLPKRDLVRWLHAADLSWLFLPVRG